MNLDRTLPWVGDVNVKNFEEVSKGILNLLKENKDEVIRLILTSEGGFTDIAFSFYDLVRLVWKPKLHTIGSGSVDSSALLILLAGERRFVTPHTTLYIHQMGRHFKDVRISTATINGLGKDLRHCEDKLAEIVAEKTGGKIEKKAFLNMMLSETVLTSADALMLGLVHEILSE